MKKATHNIGVVIGARCETRSSLLIAITYSSHDAGRPVHDKVNHDGDSDGPVPILRRERDIHGELFVEAIPNDPDDIDGRFANFEHNVEQMQHQQPPYER